MLLRRKIDRYLYEQKRNKETKQQQQAAPAGRQGGATNYGHLSDRPEADQNIRCKYKIRQEKKYKCCQYPAIRGVGTGGRGGPPNIWRGGQEYGFAPQYLALIFQNGAKD